MSVIGHAMPAKTTFFPQAAQVQELSQEEQEHFPPEIQVTIYSQLPAKELMRLWKTISNHEHHQLIEEALFDKTDTEAFPYQNVIFKNILNTPMILEHRDNGYWDKLRGKMFSSLKNLKMDLACRVSRIEVLADSYDVELNFVDLLSQINSSDPELQVKGLVCLATLAPAFEKKTLAKLIEPVLKVLKEGTVGVRTSALNCLAKMVPGLEKKVLIDMIKPAKSDLCDPSDDWQYIFCCVAALNCLTAIASQLDNTPEAKLIKAIDDVKSYLTQKDNNELRKAAIKYFTVLAPHLKKQVFVDLFNGSFVRKTPKLGCSQIKDELSKFFEVILPPLNEEDLKLFILDTGLNLNYGADTRRSTLSFLGLAARGLNKKIVNSFFESVANNLVYTNNEKPLARLVGVRAAECLALMVDKFDPKTLERLIPTLLNVLNKEGREFHDVHSAIFNTLSAMTPRLEQQELITLVKTILKIVNDPLYAHAHNSAFQCLAGIMPQLDETNLTDNWKEISELIEAKVTDCSGDTGLQACLAFRLSRVTKKDDLIDHLIKIITKQQADLYGNKSNNLLNYMITIAPHLSPTQSRKFANMVWKSLAETTSYDNRKVTCLTVLLNSGMDKEKIRKIIADVSQQYLFSQHREVRQEVVDFIIKASELFDEKDFLKTLVVPIQIMTLDGDVTIRKKGMNLTACLLAKFDEDILSPTYKTALIGSIFAKPIKEITAARSDYEKPSSPRQSLST